MRHRFKRTSLVVLTAVMVLTGLATWTPLLRQESSGASLISVSPQDRIDGVPRGSAATAIAFARSAGAGRIADVTAYINEVYRLAPIVGIDPAVVVAQSAIETGNWTSSYWTSHLNPGGIGIHYSGAASYHWYSGVDAARFQISLLYIYVNGPIPIGHLLRPYLALGPGYAGPIDAGFAGKVKIINDLSGRWAVDVNYGQHIARRGNEIYGGSGSTNVITPKPIVNTYASAGTDSGRVLDGNLSTTWAVVGNGTSPPGRYFQLDLGVPTRLSSVGWIFRLTGYADSMRIRVSEDGVTWTTVLFTGNAPVLAWQALEIDRVARFVRFNVDNPNRDPNIGYIAEVRLYGAVISPPAPIPTPKTPTPTPSATIAPLTASGGSSGATFTGRIRDGKLSTDWRTTTVPAPSSAFAYVDLGGPAYISSVGWVFSQTGGAPLLRIETSNDKLTWTTVATAGDASALVWQHAAVGTTARYVRCVFVNSTSVAVLGYLAEVTINTGAVPTSPTSSPTPTPTPTLAVIPASGGSSGATFTGRIRDGRLDTDWRTNTSQAPSSANVYISLESLQAIGTVSWVFSQAGGNASVDIQVSADKLNWVTVASRSNAPANVWQSVEANQSARYVRWFFTNTTNAPVLGYLAEVSVSIVAIPTATATATETATATATTTLTPTVPATSTGEASASEVVLTSADSSALPVTAPLPIVSSIDSDASGVSGLAHDGDIVTDWKSSSSSGAWLTINLGVPVNLEAVAWLFSRADCAETLQIEQSIDGAFWLPVFGAGSASNGIWQVALTSGEAIYVRWTFTNSSGLSQLGCLAEVAVWGSPIVPEAEATVTEVPTEPTAIATETPTIEPTQTEPQTTVEPTPTEPPVVVETLEVVPTTEPPPEPSETLSTEP